MKSVDVAEELTQNVFLKIRENHESISLTSKGVKDFDSYGYTIAYRQKIDYIRGKQVRESFYNDQIVSNVDLVDTEAEYIAEETRLLVEIKIENMPERQRLVYRLSRAQGIPNDKIAKRLDVRKRTIENQLSLAMKRIRRVLSLII